MSKVRNIIKNIFLKKNRFTCLLVIILISLAGSFLFFRSELAVTGVSAGEILSKSIPESKGRVLAAFEKSGLMPAETYIAIYPEYNLPKNDYKVIIPVKNPAAPILAVHASSSLVVDRKSNAVLWENNSSEKRSIASITKLMTALVFLGTDPDWEKIYRLQKEDVRIGGRSYIYPGDEMAVKDLFYLTLVGSDNTAAVALAKSTGLTTEEFVAKMNSLAKELRLNDTSFQDISGLSKNNISTAKDVLILAKRSLAKNKIREATMKSGYEFKTVAGRIVSADSTDYLLESFPVDGINIFGGKTGHTEEAGYCFVGNFKNESEREIISVVMGSSSNEDRFLETKKLVRWVYDNYSWLSVSE